MFVGSGLTNVFGNCNDISANTGWGYWSVKSDRNDDNWTITVNFVCGAQSTQKLNLKNSTAIMELPFLRGIFD